MVRTKNPNQFMDVGEGSSRKRKGPASSPVLPLAYGAAEERVLKQLRKKNKAYTICEREVILNDFRGTALEHLIVSAGWHKVATPSPCYLDLVYEFYANFNPEIENPGHPHYQQTWVRGMWIPFTPDVIDGLLGLTHDRVEPVSEIVDIADVARYLYGLPDATSPPDSFVLTELPAILRVLYIFICHNVEPTSHLTTLTPERARMLHHLAQGKKLDLGAHIYRQIVDLAQDSGRLLLFPCLISDLCRESGVPLRPKESPIEPATTITAQTLKNSKPRTGKPAADFQTQMLERMDQLLAG